MIKNREFDIIVIGAGIVGLCVAYYLCGRGRRVLTLEKRYLCSGTSGACNGNVIAGNRASDPAAALALASASAYMQLNEETEAGFELRRSGSLLLVDREHLWERAEQLTVEIARRGALAELMPGPAVRQMVPSLSEHVLGAVYSATDMSINPLLFCACMARLITRRGGLIRYYEPVKALRRRRGQSRYAVTTHRSVYHASTIVNCAGVCAAQISELLGERVDVVPNRGHLLVTEKTCLRLPCPIRDWDDLDGDSDPTAKGTGGFKSNFVLEPTHSRNLLIGKSEEPGTESDSPAANVLRTIAKRALEVIPALAHTAVIRSYVGHRPQAGDGLPIIGQSRLNEGYYYAVGHGGDGISTAPATGQLVDRIISGGEIDMDVRRFSPHRETQEFGSATTP